MSDPAPRPRVKYPKPGRLLSDMRYVYEHPREDGEVEPPGRAACRQKLETDPAGFLKSLQDLEQAHAKKPKRVILRGPGGTELPKGTPIPPLYAGRHAERMAKKRRANGEPDPEPDEDPEEEPVATAGSPVVLKGVPDAGTAKVLALIDQLLAEVESITGPADTAGPSPD